MKKVKILSLIIALVLLLSSAIPCAFAEYYVTIGNVVNDSSVNIKDATAIQKHIAGIITLDYYQLASADTNGDGEVNIKDSTTIQKHVAGFSTVSEMGVVITLPQEEPKATPDESETAPTEPATATIPTCTGCDIPEPPQEPLPTDHCGTVPADPIEKPSTPDNAPREIYHNVEQTMIVTDYEGRDTGDTILYLVKSPEKLKEIISGIKVDMYPDGTYTTPDIGESYTEEFFKEYALIISLNYVGGSNCSQQIEKLTVAGETLTVYRSVYYPEIVLCDMNWQYVLIKAKAEDISNINTLADNTTTLDMTFPSPTEATEKATDPTEATEVTEPTVPATDITPDPTYSEPSTTETAEITDPTEDTTTVMNGRVSYSIIEVGRIENYYLSDQTRVFYADTKEKALEAFAQVITSPYSGDYYLKPTLDNSYNEEYFEDKALIISLNCVGGSNCCQSIDKITVENGVLHLYRSIYQPLCVTCDMNYQFVLIEVSKEATGNITQVENHSTYYTIEDE